MGVLVEAISVIVPVAALVERYASGVEGYERDAPNGTFCRDRHLTRVGFMAPPDVRTFVDALARLGLVLHNGTRFVDIAVVDQMTGPTAKCDWLEAGRHPPGFSVAWLRGASPTPMAGTIGWSIEQSMKLRFTPSERVASDLLALERRDHTDVLLDFTTGREVYVARTVVRHGPVDD